MTTVRVVEQVGEEIELGKTISGVVTPAATASARSPSPGPFPRRCLVLAFEDFDDLPDDWRQFATIDAYGIERVTDAELEALTAGWAGEVTVHRGLLNIMRWSPPPVPYDHCFIRHPDPWGEPRNWLRAIAALGACLVGELTGLFYAQHEVLAFNFLLTAMLDKANVALADVSSIPDDGRKGALRGPCVRADWTINPGGLQAAMEQRYRQRLGQAMRRFYLEMGPFQRDVAYFKPRKA